MYYKLCLRCQGALRRGPLGRTVSEGICAACKKKERRGHQLSYEEPACEAPPLDRLFHWREGSIPCPPLLCIGAKTSWGAAWSVFAHSGIAMEEADGEIPMKGTPLWED